MAEPRQRPLAEWFKIRQRESGATPHVRIGAYAASPFSSAFDEFTGPIGPPVIDPLAVPSIIIATIDHTHQTRAYGLRYEYSMGNRGRAEFSTRDYDSFETAFRPQVDQVVELKQYGATLFRGQIITVQDKPLGDPGVGTVTAVTAVDYWAKASLRRVTEFYAAGQSLKTVVTSLVTNYLAVYGLFVDPLMLDGPGPMPALTFDGVTVEDAFNQLVDLTNGWVYRVQPTGMVMWFGQMHRTFMDIWSAENRNIMGPVTWAKSRVQHANRVIVRYGTGLVGGGQTFHGNGTQVRFPLTFPVAQVGHLQYIGGPYPPPSGAFELVGADATTARPWYVDAATQELVRQVGAAIPGGVAAAPAVGHTINFYYNIQFPQIATAQTTEALTAPIDAIVERADIFDPAQAAYVAQSQLEKLTVMPRQLTFKTRYPGAQIIMPGDSMRVDVPSRTLPMAIWLVVEAATLFDVDQVPTTTVTLLEGTGGVLLFSWINFWRDAVGAGSGVGIATGSVITPPHTPNQPPAGTVGGNVVGPSASTDLALARWDGVTGKLLQNSLATLSDAGLLRIAGLYYSVAIAAGSSGAAKTLDLSTGNEFSLTLTASCVLTLANPANGARYTLMLTQGGVGGWTMTWPANVRWNRGTPPVLTPTAGRTDLITFMYLAVEDKYVAAYNLNYDLS